VDEAGEGPGRFGRRSIDRSINIHTHILSRVVLRTMKFDRARTSGTWDIRVSTPYISDTCFVGRSASEGSWHKTKGVVPVEIPHRTLLSLIRWVFLSYDTY